MSEWNAWSPEDRAWALGLDALDAQREAEKCPACGGPRSECSDKANQAAYDVEGGYCYRTKALLESLDAKTRGLKPDKARLVSGASVLKVRLNPARRRVR